MFLVVFRGFRVSIYFCLSLFSVVNRSSCQIAETLFCLIQFISGKTKLYSTYTECKTLCRFIPKQVRQNLNPQGGTCLKGNKINS